MSAILLCLGPPSEYASCSKSLLELGDNKLEKCFNKPSRSTQRLVTNQTPEPITYTSNLQVKFQPICKVADLIHSISLVEIYRDWFRAQKYVVLKMWN